MQAVDRQDEQALPAGAVDRIIEIRAQEDLVLDGDGGQLAGAHADQGIMRGRGVVLLDLPLAIPAFFRAGLSAEKRL